MYPATKKPNKIALALRATYATFGCSHRPETHLAFSFSNLVTLLALITQIYCARSHNSCVVLQQSSARWSTKRRRQVG
jgi:hypothetical protein